MKDRRFGVIDIAALLILAFVCVAILGFTSPAPAQVSIQIGPAPCFGPACPLGPQGSTFTYTSPPPVQQNFNTRDNVPDYGQYAPPPQQAAPRPQSFYIPQSYMMYPTVEQQLQADAIAAGAPFAVQPQGQYP